VVNFQTKKQKPSKNTEYLEGFLVIFIQNNNFKNQTLKTATFTA